MKKVFISGNFNILHPGHIRLFKFAKECGERLIVGVLGDELVNEKNYLSESDRVENIKSISIVDEVYLIKKSLKDSSEKIKPHIVLKGKEHENLYNEEKKIIKKFNGKLIFASGLSSFSSINLMNKELSDTKNYKFSLPDEYTRRHKISKDKLIKLIKNFKKIKLCVIGDLIIDEYINCDPLGVVSRRPFNCSFTFRKKKVRRRFWYCCRSCSRIRS